MILWCSAYNAFRHYGTIVHTIMSYCIRHVGLQIRVEPLEREACWLHGMKSPSESRASTIHCGPFTVLVWLCLPMCWYHYLSVHLSIYRSMGPSICAYLHMPLYLGHAMQCRSLNGDSGCGAFHPSPPQHRAADNLSTRTLMGAHIWTGTIYMYI